jgi:hypothetical protein
VEKNCLLEEEEAEEAEEAKHEWIEIDLLGSSLSPTLMKNESIVSLSIPFFVLVIATAVTATVTIDSWAQTLSKENPNLVVQGQTLNTTADDLDIDLTIHPNDNITDPSNTETISTEGATDIDINDIPNVGRTVIIQNETVTVTGQSVSITGGEIVAEEAANPESIIPEEETETGG